MMLLQWCIGQSTVPPDRVMRKKPVWIDMMRDTSANFYQTVKAFRLYYKHHHLPEEAAQIEKEDEFERMIAMLDDSEGAASESKTERAEKRNRLRNEKDANRYATEVKAFRGWYFNTRTWLRKDGTIIGPIERQQIIDRQQAAQRQLENQSNTKKENQ